MQKLLTIWPSMAALAVDLGLPYPTVSAWNHRGIPRRRYRQIIAAAKARGQVISADDLLDPTEKDVA